MTHLQSLTDMAFDLEPVLATIDAYPAGAD
jgi:hypothetical protein